MRQRPFSGHLLRERCGECGNRLWGLSFPVSPTPHDFILNVAICGRCDRPAEPGMMPRRIDADGRPIPERSRSFYDRTGFLIILLILPVVAAVAWAAGVILRALAGG